jgi:hypothetical protein
MPDLNFKITDAVNVVYKVTATAIITKCTYEGPMTAEGFRQDMVNNPEMFTLKWKIIEVDMESDYGDVTLARNGKEEN